MSDDRAHPSGLVQAESEETFKAVEDALNNLWDVANQLSRIKPPKQLYYRVSIFGSARIGREDPLYTEVQELARRLAHRGCDIVTGGGPGLMQAANEGENLGDPENKTRSYGLRVELPFEQGANPFVEKLYTHKSFFSRLHQFMRLSSAFVIMGGGIGTTLEAMMVWQLLQVRHAHDLPLIFVGPQWKGLVDWAKTHMLREPTPFANASDLDIPICVEGIDEVMALLEPDILRFEEGRAVEP